MQNSASKVGFTTNSLNIVVDVSHATATCITNTMAYWYDGAALAATRSPVIALFWCLIKFTTTTIQTEDATIEKCVFTNPISCTNQILVHL